MTEQEKTAFLRRLAEDHSLAQEFIIYNEVNNFVLNNEKRSEFISTLKEVESSYFKTRENTANKNSHKLILRIAASVAILIVTTLSLYFIFYSKPSNKELFAQYYHPLKVDAITRSVTDSTSTIQKGLIAYQTDNYKNCLQILASDTFPPDFRTSIMLIKGLSYIELSNNADAEKLLKQASEDKNNAYHDDCLWYLSLLYIKMDKPQQSIPLLKKLIENRSVYSKQATELLGSIE